MTGQQFKTHPCSNIEPHEPHEFRGRYQKRILPGVCIEETFQCSGVERPVPTTDGWPRTVEEASAAAHATLASGATHGSVIVRGEPSPHPPTREQIAEAIAKAEDADYWVDEVRQWEALERWERDAQPQEYPGMAYEDRESFLRTADAVALIQNGADRG